MNHPESENPESHNQPHKIPEQEGALEVDRGAIVHDWITEANTLAEQTKVPEALSIIEFLKERAVPVEPIAGGFRAATKHTGERAIYMLPLIAADSLLDDRYRRKVKDDRRVAAYLPALRVIELNESIPTSQTWKGILTLHEGRHAQQHTERQYDWHDPDIFCAEERDTFMFQAQVMAHIGGKAYQGALDNKSKSLEGVLVDLEDGRISFPGTGPYEKLLDDAFGAALSGRERGARQTALWIDAVFQLFDRHFGAERGAKEKLFFMKSLYKK